MAKKQILVESQYILRVIPSEQLMAFVKMRNDEEMWKNLQQYFRDQKFHKMDTIYGFRRPKDQDGIFKNAIEHEYYAGRIAEMVVFLQVIENASDELARRERMTEVKK